MSAVEIRMHLHEASQARAEEMMARLAAKVRNPVVGG
jgi:hypothetical protein